MEVFDKTELELKKYSLLATATTLSRSECLTLLFTIVKAFVIIEHNILAIYGKYIDRVLTYRVLSVLSFYNQRGEF
jgi:hypothetical protein